MTTVNKPMDPAKRDEDVNRKLQIYGIIAAFQAGKVPSNEQIDVALNSFLASKAISAPSNELSSDGKKLVADFADVVKRTKHMVLSKNQGNLLQDFIWQTENFDAATISPPNSPVDKATAQRHGQDALQGLRTLGTLIITNGQFRKLLSDCVTLLRDMVGDAAASAAGKVKPSDEALANMDAPAQDNVWHDAPDFSKGNIKAQLQGAVKKGTSTADGGSLVSDEQAGALANTAVDNAQSGATSANPATRLEAAKNVAGTVGNVATENVQQQKQAGQDPTGTAKDSSQESAAKAKAREYRSRGRDYLVSKMPAERRDRTIWRLKKMILECQQHPDYQQAIETLLSLAEQYGSHASTLTKQGAGSAQQTRSALSIAEGDLKTLIERFANGTSTDDLWTAMGQLYADADRDPELKGWFSSVDKFVRRCLQEQGYVLEDASTNDWNKLNDRGQYLLRNKYPAHTDAIINETKFLADQFDQDPQNRAFADSMARLFKDLGNDERGQPTFKPHLIKDLAEVILPAVLENISYVPVPRIEYSDAQVDLAVENLVVESDNFMPNVFEVASENHVRWGRKLHRRESGALTSHKHSMEVKVSGVQLDLRDVAYYVRRKQGFPKITDQGVANIYLPGDGFSFKLKLKTAEDNDRQNFFKVDKVDVDMRHLKVKILQSRHKLLLNLLNPLVLRIARPVVQVVAEKMIRKYVDQADSMLYQVKLEADRAMDEARQQASEDASALADDPQQLPNFYRRYYDALQKAVLQGKKKAAEKQAQTQQTAAEAAKRVNIAITTKDSILPDVKLPGGTTTKATEYYELAKKGDKWESPVFSVGTASASNDVPTAPQISRKQGGARQGNKVGASLTDATDNTQSTNGTGAGAGAGAGVGASNYGSGSMATGANGVGVGSGSAVGGTGMSAGGAGGVGSANAMTGMTAPSAVSAPPVDRV